MRVCVYQPEDRDFLVYKGTGEVLLPSLDVSVRSRFGSVPLHLLPIRAKGSFEKEQLSEEPNGVVVSQVALADSKTEQKTEEPDPFDEFLWAGVKGFFVYTVFRWIWKKI